MRPGALVALLIALLAMAGSIGLGLWNRFVPGDPGVVIQADREAFVRGGFDRGTRRSLSLRIDLRPRVLDEALLRRLGFRRRHHGSPLRREVLLVLEHDTLLTVIDAGLNPDSLEARYSDRQRFLIVRGLVGAYYYSDRGVADGYLRSPLPSELYLPPGSGSEGRYRLRAGRLRLPFVTE